MLLQPLVAMDPSASGFTSPAAVDTLASRIAAARKASAAETVDFMARMIPQAASPAANASAAASAA